MFNNIAQVPGDPILGLIETYKKDTNPRKVDLGVGVYRSANGTTPILKSVKKAGAWLQKSESTKEYIGSHGDPQFSNAMLSLVLGKASPAVLANRASASQTLGGSGALKVGADFIKSHLPMASIWMPSPTWSNHIGIFKGAGIGIREYSYIDKNNSLDFDNMIEALKQVPSGDVVLLHACCHNPTGFDLSQSQWGQVLEVVRARKLLPLIDLAYQGFGDGIEEDAYGVRLLAEGLDELIITCSCSKNFGLYRERTGCLILIAKTTGQMKSIRSQLAVLARGNYSSPPHHGGAVVSVILESDILKSLWLEELREMRSRIIEMRHVFLDAMAIHGLKDNFSNVISQRGIFSYTGLTVNQVERLRKEFSIYMVGSGRANISGLTTQNISYVAEAVAGVVST